MISDDQGRTWREVAVPDSTGCVHMNIQPTDDGSLLALFRSRWADFIYCSRCSDAGETWTAPEPIELPNNNASIKFVTLRDGRLALVYNHSSALDATERRLSLYDEITADGLVENTDGPAQPQLTDSPVAALGRSAFWGAPRAPLSLAISSDGGATWPVRRDMEVGDGYCLTNNSREGLNREYSYPSIQSATPG